MARNIEAVLFDLDDTLGDWETAIEAALAVAFASGSSQEAKARVRQAMHAITHELRDGQVVNRNHWMLWRPDGTHWRDVLGDDALVPHLDTAFASAARPTKYTDCSVLAELHARYRIGLLTNNPYGKTALEEYGLIEHFDAVVMMDDPYRKPHPRAFEEGCAAIACEPGRIAFVGDSLANDVEGALAAGLIPVWIDRFNDNCSLPPGVYRIESLLELPALLHALG